MLNIQNRRYLGNKRRVLPFIVDVMKNENLKFDSFVDLFAGTGIVGEHFNILNRKIIVNDLLYCNYLAYIAWLSDKDYDKDKIKKIIKEFNNIKVTSSNYVSENFSNTYFTHDNALKIGAIREEIENMKKNLTFREYAILITSLIYATDSVANTFGHYGAYNKKMERTTSIMLQIPEIKDNSINKGNEIYNVNSTKLAKYIKADLVYIDPPYNGRQYAAYYHLLENISRWDKPNLIGKTLKPYYINEIKSEYCTKHAKEEFEELINNLDCKYIIVSYNNANENIVSKSSIHKINLNTMKDILSKKGVVNIYEDTMKSYCTKNSRVNNYKERLFVCKIN